MKNSEFDLTYLSIDSIQEGVGSSQIAPLIFGLSDLGKRICLVTFEKKEPSPELVDRFQQSGVVWKPLEFGKVGAIAGVARLNELRKLVPTSDVLHGRSDIPTAAAIWSKVDAPVLWDVRSLWSDQRQLIGTAGWNNLTARGARTLEDVSAKGAAAMTTLTAAIVPILEKRHKRLPPIREVIPTCVQTTKFLPTPMPKGQITCLLSGTFNNYYDLPRTKMILDEIRKTIDLKVIWARGGESPSKSLGVGEDLIVSAHHSEMPKLVSQAHFGIAICKDDHKESLAAAVPTKIGEFLSAGRPVIVSKGIGDLDTLLANSRTGLILGNDQDLSQVASRLMSLLTDAGIQERCRVLAMDHFDMGKAVLTYENIYSKMLEAR